MVQSKIQNLKSKIETDLSGFDFVQIGRKLSDISRAPVLVLSPHPDDDVIGMGGTMRKLADQGTSVFSVYITTGSAPSDKKSAGIRRSEAIAALKVVRASGAFFLQHDSTALRKKYRTLAAQLRRIFFGLVPSEIYLPSPFERHPTHRLVTRSALAAAAGLQRAAALWGYSVWGGVYGLRGMKAVDISSYLGIKQKAIRRHASQLALKPYDRGILGRNIYEGIYLHTHGEKYAAGAEMFIDLTRLKPDKFF